MTIHKSFKEFEEAALARKQFNVDRKRGRGRAASRHMPPEARLPKSIWVGMIRTDRRAKLQDKAMCCDRCDMQAQAWGELYIEYAVKGKRGSDQALANHACLCEQCRIEFQAVRHGFKLVMHYKNWVARQREELEAYSQLLSQRDRAASQVELVDDDEFERLMRNEGE